MISVVKGHNKKKNFVFYFTAKILKILFFL